MKLRPLFDNVVIKLVETETTTPGGIVLPTAAKEKPQLATVIAVGPGGHIDGHDVEMQVKVGDSVLFSKYAGTEFKQNGEEFIVLKQSNILAVVD